MSTKMSSTFHPRFSELCSLISENEIKRQRSIIQYLLDDLGDALIASAEQVEISFVHQACLWDTESTFKDLELENEKLFRGIAQVKERFRSV